MVAGRIGRWSLVTTVVFISAAFAQTGSSVRAAGGANLRVTCGEDLRRFCADVQPGGGRLVQCLSSHTNELSEACGNVVGTARGGAKLRAACAEDLQRLCAGVQRGRGRLIQCLSSHPHELSAACESMISAMPARGGTPGSSSQSPAAQPAVPAATSTPPAAMGVILRASCGPDAQRLCAGTRREIDVLKCLDSQRMKLSAACGSYFQKLGALPTEQRNIPNKKPPSLPQSPAAKPPIKENSPEPGPG